ncbi:MAG: phage portal protein [Synergistes sp.]|nr:phage portal protein [Synergistes sp.]
MFTDYSFLEPGAAWPPKDTRERARLKRYSDNDALFDGQHEFVFREVWTRLFRRDPFMQMSIEMCLPWPKRLSTLWADLLVGETPGVSDAKNDELTQYLSDLAKRLNLWRAAYQAAIDTSRFGDAVLKVRRDDQGKTKVAVIHPSCWFPVVSETDCTEVTAHVLAWPTGDPEKGTGRLQVEIHEPGRVEYRVYDHSGGALNPAAGIGRLLEVREERTDVDAPLVVHIANTATSGRLYGHDDYSDLTAILQELEVRFAQNARILDKHADPKMFGPDHTRKDEETGQTVADIGDYVPLDEGETPPGYIAWNAQMESSFRQIEDLMQQFYMLSETSPAVFGDIKSGLAESGSALKRLLMAPLAKVNRIRLGFDAGIREVIRLAALLDRGKAVEPSITWKDGLPDDEAEAVNTSSAAVGAGISSKLSAIKRTFGLDDKQAAEEMKQIAAEAEADRIASPDNMPLDGDDDE